MHTYTHTYIIYIYTSVKARQNNGFKYCCILYVNPLWTKFFFRRFLGHSLIKIVSFHLQTHRRDAHRKFFDDPFLK